MDQGNRGRRGAAWGGAILALGVLGAAAPAQAVELWTLSEVRVRLTDHQVLLPRYLRIFNDYRYGERYGGVGQALLRLGPIWEPLPGVQVAAHVTTSLEQRVPGVLGQELRLELEPSYRWQTELVAVSARTRLERRWLSTGPRWRGRLQLRTAFHPRGVDWAPFTSAEGFLEEGSFNQSRVAAGFSHLWGRSARFDLGLMLRGRLSEAWTWDQVLTVGWFFNPDIEPLLFDGSGD